MNKCKKEREQVQYEGQQTALLENANSIFLTIDKLIKAMARRKVSRQQRKIKISTQ